MSSEAQVKAGMLKLKAIAAAIRELKEVPNGHLYAQLMGHMGLDEYNSYLNSLKEAKMITESDYLITWIGK